MPQAIAPFRLAVVADKEEEENESTLFSSLHSAITHHWAIARPVEDPPSEQDLVNVVKKRSSAFYKVAEHYKVRYVMS